MGASARSVVTLLAGVTILVTGQGLLLGLVPLALDRDGAGIAAIAAAGTAYFAGFLAGAWWGERMIRSVGHIRTYGGLIALVIAATLALPLWPGTGTWVGLRFLHGAAAGGTFLAIEAWLNAASPAPWRGRVLAAYMVCTLAALGVGQLLVAAVDRDGTVPFIVGGLLYAVSIVPVMLSRIAAPATDGAERASLADLARISPFGLITSWAGGLALGAFWALAPYFASHRGLAVDEVALLMAVAIASGLALQWPAAHLSDRIDRRGVVMMLAVAGVAAAALLAVPWTAPRGLLVAVFAVLGGVFCLYPLAVAHGLDFADRADSTLLVSRGLLLANGFGLALGPFAAGPFVLWSERSGLMFFFVGVLGLVAAIALWRMSERRAIPAARRGPFVFLRATTPAGADLDPRVDEAGLRHAARDTA